MIEHKNKKDCYNQKRKQGKSVNQAKRLCNIPTK